MKMNKYYLFSLLILTLASCTFKSVQKTSGLQVVDLDEGNKQEKLKIQNQTDQFVGPLPTNNNAMPVQKKSPEPVVALILSPSNDEHYSGFIGAFNGFEALGLKNHIISSIGPTTAIGLIYADAVNAKKAEWEFFKTLGNRRTSQSLSLSQFCTRLGNSQKFNKRSLQQLSKLFYLAQPSAVLQETELSTRGNIKDILTTECLGQINGPLNYKAWIEGLVELGADIVVVLGPPLSKDEQDMLNLDLKESQLKRLGNNNLAFFIPLKSIQKKQVDIQKVMAIQKKHVLEQGKSLRTLLDEWKKVESLGSIK